MVIASFALGVACVLMTALLGRQVLEVAFGSRFTAAYGALTLLILAAALQLISHTLASYVQVYINPARIFLIYLAGMAVYVVAAPVGVKMVGMNGAAFGQVLFSCAVIWLSWFALRPALKEYPRL